LGSTRSFILTRATYAGGQRHSALWTGDNFANDAHLLLGARMVSGMGLSGFPFSGNDVGGFTGEASAALYMRWVACATFHPLMRAHTMINSRHAEPWSFGEECTEVARNYLRLRYMLLPHLYALFFESTLSGMPPVRALLFRFYKEWKVFSKEFENQFLLGSHLMICPVEAEARFAKVYLPEGNWFNFFNDRLYQGGTEHLVELQRDIIPVFVQAGGIIPTKMGTVNNSADPGEERMGLHVYLGAEGHYHYYEDDGLTRGGDSCKRHIDLGLETLTIGAAEGDFKSVFKSIRIFFHGFQGHSLTVNGNMAKVGQIDFRFLDAISNFDPYESYPDGPKLIEHLRFVDIAAWADEVKITFL
jgi:alpha-glucosidase